MKSNDEYPKVILKRIILASREQVFDAWTKPELMEKWFFPGAWSAKTTNDLRVGGKYTHDMISDGGNSPCDQGRVAECGESNVHHGEYLEIKRPEKLVFTWNSSLVTNSRVTIVLNEVEEGTELVLTHELLATEDLRNRHTQGWEGCLQNLMHFFN